MAISSTAGCFAARGGDATVEVMFDIIAETQWGDQVWAVGAAEALGSWSPQRALELHTCAGSYPRWSGRVALPSSALKGALDYKFVITHSDGSVHWEPGSNRTLTQASSKRVDVSPPRFGEPCPPQPASEPESEDSTCAEDDSWSEGHLSECTLSQTSLQPDSSSANLSEAGTESVSGSSPFRLSAGVHRLAKPWGHCEDSYFIGSRALGVADGVGEMVRFADLGVDAAVYAASLMEFSATYLHGEDGAAFLEANGPRVAAVRAVAEAEAKTTSYGASTVAVLALSPDGTSAGVANLGDSGFIHFRRTACGAMEIVERSREQEHAFNCPYQLCHVPKELARRLVYRDTASLCAEYELELQLGDLLLMCTDGLTDNLHAFEITDIINTAIEASGGKVAPQPLAETLASAAHERSLDPAADTPFSRAARRHRHHVPGGKPDDITVALAWVEPDEGSGEVRLGRPHQADAQWTLPGQAEPAGRKAMQRGATRSLLHSGL